MSHLTGRVGIGFKYVCVILLFKNWCERVLPVVQSSHLNLRQEPDSARLSQRMYDLPHGQPGAPPAGGHEQLLRLYQMQGRYPAGMKVHSNPSSTLGNSTFWGVFLGPKGVGPECSTVCSLGWGNLKGCRLLLYMQHTGRFGVRENTGKCLPRQGSAFQ